jgi:CRISPR/Cas system CSM-associated protein Csm3 (group 7 of RAMP superfamily)
MPHWLAVLFEGMRLLEDDYLGGYGSRGAGKIAFENLRVELRPLRYYRGEGGSHRASSHLTSHLTCASPRPD